ncbi:MAG TPA: hypothetical protein PKN32_06295 [Bacteroidales bacterium]|nr:hypothetical protein [Bacteroidales bacterium]
MSDFNISKTWISINCPKCDYSIDIQLRDAMIESTVYCHNCKISIKLLDGSASASRNIKSIENKLDELNRTLKNLF